MIISRIWEKRSSVSSHVQRTSSSSIFITVRIIIESWTAVNAPVHDSQFRKPQSVRLDDYICQIAEFLRIPRQPFVSPFLYKLLPKIATTFHANNWSTVKITND